MAFPTATATVSFVPPKNTPRDKTEKQTSAQNDATMNNRVTRRGGYVCAFPTAVINALSRMKVAALKKTADSVII